MEELDLYLYAIVVFFKNIFFSSQLVFVSLLFRSAWVFSFSFVIRRYLVTLRVSRWWIYTAQIEIRVEFTWKVDILFQHIGIQ